jgi:CheY-like chemotaxis protein
LESAVPVTTEIKLRGRAKSAQGVRNRARVLIVNSHPITRMGLGDLINGQPDLVVCDEAGNAAEALQTLKKNGPNLVLSELGLPDNSGLELLKDIKAMHPGLPVRSFQCTMNRFMPSAPCKPERAAIL